MDILLGLMIVIPLMIVTLYAHLALILRSSSWGRSWLARGPLFVVAFGLGVVVAAMWAPAGEFHKVIGYLSGFGLAHVPAAAILFFTRARPALARQ